VGFSAVPLPKNGTKITDQDGFFVIPKSKNVYFEIINAKFSNVPHKNNDNIFIIIKDLGASPIPKNSQNFVKHDGVGAKPKIFMFSNNRNLKFNFLSDLTTLCLGLLLTVIQI
jgi:hypothetical protein